jgi:diguanylate cyclase (GGDEF)-like protein
MYARVLKRLETLLQAEPQPAHKVLLIAVCLVLTPAVATAHLSIHAHLALSLTLLPPTMLIAWYLGLGWGLATALLVVVTWLVADLLWIDATVPGWVVYVSACVRASVFCLVAFLVAALRQAYRQQRLLATSDALTSLGNRVEFMSVAEAERQRAARFGHPVTLAYLDLDDFKAVNDRFGHDKGDEVLRLVGRFLRKRLRSIDSAARLGGDEFVVLLPQTGERAGMHVIADLQAGIAATLLEHGFEVMVSAGVATFLRVPRNVDEMLKLGDQLMYEAKREGKGNLRHALRPNQDGHMAAPEALRPVVERGGRPDARDCLRTDE